MTDFQIKYKVEGLSWENFSGSLSTRAQDFVDFCFRSLIQEKLAHELGWQERSKYSWRIDFTRYSIGQIRSVPSTTGDFTQLVKGVAFRKQAELYRLVVDLFPELRSELSPKSDLSMMAVRIWDVAAKNWGTEGTQKLARLFHGEEVKLPVEQPKPASEQPAPPPSPSYVPPPTPAPVPSFRHESPKSDPEKDIQAILQAIELPQIGLDTSKWSKSRNCFAITNGQVPGDQQYLELYAIGTRERVIVSGPLIVHKLVIAHTDVLLEGPVVVTGELYILDSLNLSMMNFRADSYSGKEPEVPAYKFATPREILEMAEAAGLGATPVNTLKPAAMPAPPATPPRQMGPRNSTFRFLDPNLQTVYDSLLEARQKQDWDTINSLEEYLDQRAGSLWRFEEDPNLVDRWMQTAPGLASELKNGLRSLAQIRPSTNDAEEDEVKNFRQRLNKVAVDLLSRRPG